MEFMNWPGSGWDGSIPTSDNWRGPNSNIYIYIENNNDIWTLIHFCSHLEIRLPSYSVETEDHPPRCEPVSLGAMRVSLLYCSVNKCEEIIREFDSPLNENVMLTVAIS